MKVKTFNKILLSSFIFAFVLFSFTFYKYKRSVRGLFRIIKQEFTQPEMKNYDRLPSIFNNVGTYISFLFSQKQDSQVVNNIKDFSVLSNSNDEFYELYDEIFMSKLYYFETEKKNPFIVDCGSNIGMSVLFFKMLYPDSEILGFEPSSKNFNLLSENINNNNLNNVKVINNALADKLTQIKLYGAGTPLGSIISDNPHNPLNYELVNTVMLSDYIDRNVDLLKIDTEGAEFIILKNLDDNNKLGFIDRIIMEYHHFTTQNDLSKLLELLERNNFAYQICTDQHPPIENRLAQHFFIYAYKNGSKQS